MTNNCGTCTACCRVYSIPEFNKPAGKWCDKCTVGKGCNIYETRPTRCAEFECLWLLSQTRTPFPLELRPDKCKVVFSPTTNERIMAAINMPGSPDAWKRKIVQGLIKWLHAAGVGVAVSSPQSLVQLLLRPDGTQRTVKMTEPDADGMQWSTDTGGNHEPSKA
jgi:hypothetical protein